MTTVTDSAALAASPELLLAAAPDGHPWTDVGNAERLVAAFGDELRYCHTWGKWLVWTGTRWALDETGSATLRAKATVRAMLHDAIERDVKGYRSHAITSEREPRIRAMLTLAQSDRPILSAELDCDPWLLNVANGTVDLRTGELRGHDRKDLLTKLASVGYDPDATAPRWQAFLERVLVDPELIAFVQRLAGYALTGDTREQVLPILYGSGANGKTTFVETLRAMMGDYGQQAPAETFLERRDTSVPNDVARLRGARLVAAAETGEGRRLNETLVKRMTGGDSIAARFMRGEWFEFIPSFKVLLVTNHRPEIRGTDEAIWRRIRLVPFTVTIPEHERDPTLRQKLADELPGILAWAVAGCLDWQADGLGTPEAVATATAEYRNDEDAVGRFIDEKCLIGPDLIVKSKDLNDAYKQWAEANGEKAEGTKGFANRLRERDFTRSRKKTGSFWNGLGLMPEGDR